MWWRSRGRLKRRLSDYFIWQQPGPTLKTEYFKTGHRGQIGMKGQRLAGKNHFASAASDLPNPNRNGFNRCLSNMNRVAFVGIDRPSPCEKGFNRRCINLGRNWGPPNANGLKWWRHRAELPVLKQVVIVAVARHPSRVWDSGQERRTPGWEKSIGFIVKGDFTALCQVIFSRRRCLLSFDENCRI